MKNYRLNVKDLFDDRIVYLAVPGYLKFVKVMVARKNHFSDERYVLFHSTDSGNPLLLSKPALDPSVGVIRMFAKQKQAKRYSEQPGQPRHELVIKSPSGLFLPNECLVENKGFFDPV